MNLIQYISKQMNVDFNRMPFNKFDGLVFARLSYIKFDHYINFKKFKTSVPLKKIIRIIMNEGFDEKYIKKNDFSLINTIFTSKRYKNIKIKKFENKFDEDTTQQFSATAFIHRGLIHTFTIFAFRGTDGTLTGWKEDFNMAYMDKVPAQTLAINFVNTYKKPLLNEAYHFVGHSKGGNLALVAAGNFKLKRNSIESIFLFDSPGLNDEEAKKDIYQLGTIQAYTPPDSIFGRMLNTNYPVSIVDSEAKLLYQHDVYNWKIEDGDFVYLDEYSKASNRVSNYVNNNLMALSNDEKKEFIDVIFNLLAKTSDDPIHDLFNNFKPFAKSFFATYLGATDREKEIIKDFISASLYKPKKKKKEKLIESKDEENG